MVKHALDIINEHAQDGCSLRERFFAENSQKIDAAAIMVAVSLARHGKLLLCGNGGSAADAQHVAGEFVNRFMLDRPPLPAIALSTDSSVLTAIGNDFGYDLVFYKQIQALGRPGDVLLAISTSGNSANVIKGIEAARERGVLVIGLTGGQGGAMARLCDLLINVNHPGTPLVQEVHLAVEHLICLLCDHYLFENAQALQPHLEKTASIYA